MALFEKSTRPVAVITQGDGYHVLRMGEREIGGTVLAALKRYAREQGYTVQVEDKRVPVFQVRHGL